MLQGETPVDPKGFLVAGFVLLNLLLGFRNLKNLDMLYTMLGVIIFLLTFCALGAVAIAEQKGRANTLIKVALFWNVLILGGIYYFFQ